MESMEKDEYYFGSFKDRIMISEKEKHFVSKV
jgi:hypothetical protein